MKLPPEILADYPSHRVWISLLSMAVLALSNGCLLDIQSRVCSPGAKGIVLDAKTQRPIAGAQVAVAEYVPSTASEQFEDPITISNVLRYTRRPHVKTDETGTFSIRPKHKIIVIILFGDYFTPGGTLLAKREGYQTKAVPISIPVPIEETTNGFGRKIFLDPIEK